MCGFVARDEAPFASSGAFAFATISYYSENVLTGVVSSSHNSEAFFLRRDQSRNSCFHQACIP
jgi:hypothetical protein